MIMIAFGTWLILRSRALPVNDRERPMATGGVISESFHAKLRVGEVIISKKAIERAAALGMTPSEYLKSELVREYRKGRRIE